jgi:hypothetical protein
MRKLFFAVVAVVVLSSCSQAPQSSSIAPEEKKEEAAKPAEPLSAKTAFWPMYTSARTWATDFYTLKIEAKAVPGFKNAGGKAAMWEATFASPSQHEYRVYSNAIAAYPPDIYKGVVIGKPNEWHGLTHDIMPTQLSTLNVDSDAAYEAAAKDAASFLGSHPQIALSKIELDTPTKYQVPVWVFVWGDKKTGYVALVNGNTGTVLKHG